MFDFNQPILRVWNYLWRTYKQNGSVPKNISDAIALIQERVEGAI